MSSLSVVWEGSGADIPTKPSAPDNVFDIFGVVGPTFSVPNKRHFRFPQFKGRAKTAANPAARNPEPSFLLVLVGKTDFMYRMPSSVVVAPITELGA